MNKQEMIESYERVLNFVPQEEKEKYRNFIKELKELDEPQKVTVPQSVANYIEYTKVNEWDLLEAMENIAYEDDKDLRKWFNNNSENFALAWINGCEVEEEKLYKVKTKGTVGSNSYLNLDMDNYEYFWGSEHTIFGYKTKFTKAELEKAGFGEVFTCSIFDVGEVEE